MHTNDTGGTATFTPAVREAFRQFAESSEPHKALLVFTDGNSETVLPACLIRRLNSGGEVHVHVRVPQHVYTHTVAMIEMALPPTDVCGAVNNVF